MIPSTSINYIKGFDGLRCIGSFIVLFFHIERAKILFGIPSIGSYYVKIGIGQSTMTMFFVLSGFLIFYILMNEKYKTGNVDIKLFYKKRMARIYPVYYFVFFSVVLFLANNNLFTSISKYIVTDDYYIVVALYFLNLPNTHLFFQSSLLALGHFWSVGVEIQFYVIAPWIVKKFQNIVKILLLIIFIKVSLKLMVASVHHFLPLDKNNTALFKDFEHFLYKLRFEAFALGGIAAIFLVENKTKILQFLYLPIVQFLNILLLLVLIPFENIWESSQVILAINCAVLILNMTGNDRPLFLVDNKIVNYLGKISYGVYMYQIPLIFLITNSLKNYYTSDNFLMWNFFYYAFCFLFSFSAAIISYELLEKKIIRWTHY